MPTMENRSGSKVVVRLATGVFLHIPPHGTSAELNGVEVQNAKVAKLVERGVIALHNSGGRGSGRSSR